MPFDLAGFVRRWPYAYHLTSRGNLRSIASSSRLESACSLMTKAECEEWLRTKRVKSLQMTLNETQISIRDQAPLYSANIRFEGGWEFPDLIEAINGLVFFWPGDGHGPNSYGRRHYNRYAVENPVVLRTSTPDLIAKNPDNVPLFCACNSGSPRHSGGTASPRGPETFQTAVDFTRSVSKVIEPTFKSLVLLPSSAEFRFSPADRWTDLAEHRR